MKLETFLLGCSPLPWDYHEANASGNNRSYARHAANSLPELVKAIKKVTTSHDTYPASGQAGNCQCWNCIVLKAALAAAEEVKTP